MSMNDYVCYALQVGSNTIEAVSTQGFDPGTEMQRPATDGLVDPRRARIDIENPSAEITTTAIKQMIDSFTAVSGDPLGGANLETTSWVQFLKKLGYYGQTLEDAHVKIEATAGIAVPVTLSANNDAPATITVRATILEYTQTDGQDLSGTIAPDQEFYPGPATINYVDSSGSAQELELDGIQSIEIEFGINVQTKRSSGNPLPSIASIKSRNPVVRIVTTEASNLVTFGRGLKLSDSVATTVYLRKASQFGDRVLDATAQHIKFTMYSGGIVAKGVSGAEHPLTIELHPVYNGTNPMMAIDTASAIPAS